MASTALEDAELLAQGQDLELYCGPVLVTGLSVEGALLSESLLSDTSRLG